MKDSSDDVGARSFGTASGTPELSLDNSAMERGASDEDVIGGVRERISEATSEARDRITGIAEHTRDAVRGQVQHLREMDWQGMTDHTMNYARQNPGQTIIISVGVGFMLGLLLRPSR